MSELLYKRILLKLSGEALAGDDGILDFDAMTRVCEVIKTAVSEGVEVTVVIGAGNIWRGRSSGSMDRVKADNMGMLATAINSIALQDTLISVGVDAKVLSSVSIAPFAEYFTKDLAESYLKAGKVVIFACCTGHPFFSTDTGAVLRAAQMEVDALLFAKNIDGVYTADPRKDPTAKKLDDITYEEVLENHLVVIDTPATAFAMENKLKICLFGLDDPMNILRVVHGEKLGTLMHNR